MYNVTSRAILKFIMTSWTNYIYNTFASFDMKGFRKCFLKTNYYGFF